MQDSTDDLSYPTLTFVTQFFHPDTSANATVLTELATDLAERGCDVDVLTGQPAYAAGDREEAAPKRETHEGVDVRRVLSTRFDKNAGVAHRMVNELVFFVTAFLHVVVRRDDDVLVLPTAPSFLPILGWVLSRLRGRRYVPIVLDLYPDMAVQLGYLSEDGLIYRIWDALNRRAYAGADEIVTIGETMKETIEAKYGDECDVAVVHNWEDEEFIVPQSKEDNEFAAEHDLVDRTTVLYSGNLGLHHDLESVVRAAAELEAEYDDPPQFLFVGDGGKKEPLQELVADLGVDDVEFLPYQPVEVLPDSLTSGDIALVTMEEGVEGLCVSSKFYTALASGQAILAVAKEDSEIGRIVDRTDCGVRVDPRSPEQVVDALAGWLEDPAEMDRMGERARDVFEDRFTRDRAIDQYLDVFRSLPER